MKALIYICLVIIFLGCQSKIKTTRPELETPTRPIHVPTKANPIAIESKKVIPSKSVETAPPNESITREQSVNIAEKNQKYYEAASLSAQIALSNSDPKQAEVFRAKTIDLINNKLTTDELHQWSQNSDFGFFRGYSVFKLGELQLSKGRHDEAKSYFKTVMEFLPESDVAKQSQKWIEEMEATKRVSPQTIGVVVPLSGKSAAVGQKVLRGLQLGLGTNQSFSKFRIAVVDSESRSDMARIGIERLVKEDNVIAIVGGVIGKTVASELAAAQEFGVPFIYLSQRQGISDIHAGSIRNALTAEMQIRHLVRYAMTELDVSKFAVLYPNDPYGVEYANVFWDEVLVQGGQIAAAQIYDPKETDFRSVVQRLVGTFYIEARKDEYLQKVKVFKQNLKTKNSRENINTDDLLPPIQNFEAIFIPDQAKVISQISAFLNYSRVKDTKLLSTNILNTPGSGKKLSSIVYPVYFSDSFIAEGPNQSSSDFARDYVSLFNEYPAQFEISSYESGLILRQLILQGASNREEMTKELGRLKGFPGAYGPVSLTQQKDLFRPLITLTVEKGDIVKAKQ